MLLTDPREGAEQREANTSTSLQQTVSRSRRIVSRISDVSLVGQCPAIMPQHSHPYVGRLILDGRYTSTHGGQIPTMAGLGTKEKAPQGAWFRANGCPYEAYSDEGWIEVEPLQ